MSIDSITLEREKILEFMSPATAPEEPKKESEKKGIVQKKKIDEKVTLKSVLCKMVPYASFPYADHVLRTLSVEPNLKAEAKSEQQIDTLIEAAQKLKALI